MKDNFMDNFIHWPKPHLLLSATCDAKVSSMTEIWMKHCHLASDSNYNTINLSSPKNVTRNDKKNVGDTIPWFTVSIEQDEKNWWHQISYLVDCFSTNLSVAEVQEKFILNTLEISTHERPSQNLGRMHANINAPINHTPVNKSNFRIFVHPKSYENYDRVSRVHIDQEESVWSTRLRINTYAGCISSSTWVCTSCRQVRVIKQGWQFWVTFKLETPSCLNSWRKNS